METQPGSQIAYTRSSPPFSAQQFFPGGGRPRDSVNGGRQIPFPSRLCSDSSSAPNNLGSLENGHCTGHRTDWDVKTWDWDSFLFLAQPSSSAAAVTERSKASHHQGVPNGNSDKYYPLTASGDKHYESTSNVDKYHPAADGGNTTCSRVGFRLDGSSCSAEHHGCDDPDDLYIGHRRKHPVVGPDNRHASYSDKAQPFLRDGSSPEDDAESLSLKLGGHSYAFSDDIGNGSRSAKRYRSTSPGPQFPVCQVDDCKSDLSHAKDYHRRHKVCEMHAKAGKALVSRLMQRFCQQCSRFHPLTEFDEGKRSCRRRLAGHNRRRRKNQPDAPLGRGYTGAEDNGTGNAAGLVGFLNLLSSLQALDSVGALNGIINERDALQFLRKGVLSPSSGLENVDNALVANLLNLNRVLEGGRPDLKPQPITTDGHTCNRPVEPQAILSALATPKTTETLSVLLQTSLAGHLTNAIMKAAETPLLNLGQSNGASSLPMAPAVATIVDRETDHASSGPMLSLSSQINGRLLSEHITASSSRHNRNIHNQGVAENSAHCADQLQTMVPQRQLSPLAMVQRFFPLEQVSECRSTINGKIYVKNVEDDGPTESTSDVAVPASMMTYLEGQDVRMLQDIALHHSRPSIDLQQPLPHYNLNESSPSGSDQSPTSSHADCQDRTGRISIKLFDRSPGELPELLRSQILEWLANRPSDMESYIRPGCTVLTIFLSMPKSAWDKLEGDLRTSLQRLTSGGDLWSKGRIHVQVDCRSAIIVDGRIHISKPLKSAHAPQLVSVQPIAVVGGQRTKLVLRGFNLNRPGTRVFCAYQGKYTSQRISIVNQPQGLGRKLVEGATDYDELSINFDDALLNVPGRAFLEVERQLGGGSALPVIIADGAVCAELLMLEKEMGMMWTGDAAEAGRTILESGHIQHQMDVKGFLNELGWLFQQSQVFPGAAGLTKLLPSRQRHLLIFAVERDWCAVVNKLLDIVVRLMLACPDQSSAGFVEVFRGEISLLHIAVRRKCRPMVELLLAYVPCSGPGDRDLNDILKGICRHSSQHRSIFTPDMPGPEGVTPLHMAASMKDAEGILDALTSDPNQIGLHAWSDVHNSKGRVHYLVLLVEVMPHT